MNRQGSKRNPTAGIEWTHIFGPQTGFTANPVRGCEHKCQWRMPDGTVVTCYAKTQKERMSGEGSFEQISFHPDVLDAIRDHKRPAGIFIDSMSDLFGRNVERDWIMAVLQCARAHPRHVFFSLTKNPRRLLEFPFPDNMLVGLSAPPTFMYDKELSLGAQHAWFRKGLQWLSDCSARNVWLSLEPLSVDLSDLITLHRDRISWAVIGAGTKGAKAYQPHEPAFANTLQALDGLPVFFKGNIARDLAQRIAGGWREEFPSLRPQLAEALQP